MDNLQEELKELKGFIADLKADRAGQKERERREGWTKYTALSLIFIAVLAAFATQWAGKYSSRVLVRLNDSTFNQAKASDQWAYYQAKSIKQNLYEMAKDQLANGTSGGEPAKGEEKLNSKIAKYDKEKAEIQTEARRLEKLRDEARLDADQASRRGAALGSAISIFQIAVALASVCLITKKKPLWFLSMLFALVAAVKMAIVLLS